MNRVKTIVNLAVLLFVSVLYSHSVSAQNGLADDPAKVIEKVTNDLMTFVRDNSELLKTDESAYFKGVKDVISGGVAFESIAKSVMGKRYWLQANEEERAQFVEAFTSGMVETYGKGMSSFTDLDITIESSRPSDKNPNVYYVLQKVKLDSGSNKILYNMRKDEQGWRVRNVILNGINLGKTSQAQFSEAVRSNKGDVGLTIRNWGKSPS